MGNSAAAQQWPADLVQRRPISALIPAARNARTHSPEQIAQLQASLSEFGWTSPVLVDEEGVLIAGHGRILAAQALGWPEVPVMVATGWTDAQKRAYAILDNRVPLNAGWDEAILAAELDELRDLKFDMSLMGFAPGELNDLIGTPNTGFDPDEVPPAPVVPVSRTGDLWGLGAHRLLCGDSTKPVDVARLMGTAKARVMNTDPPYGVGYDSSELHAHGVDYGEIEGDDLLDGEKLQAFLESAIRTAVPHLTDDAAFYLWHPMLTQGTFFAAAAAAAADILIHRQIIWIKPVLVFGRGDYHWKHELCFYGWRRGNRPKFYGERNQTTVWEIDSVSHSERKEFAHATPKPVELFTRPLKNHTKPGDVCYEPFAGTGPQIIAAEMTDRICAAIEIAPQYVDVSVLRWQLFTGKQATLDADGRTFEEVKRERTQADTDGPAHNRGQSVEASA